MLVSVGSEGSKKRDKMAASAAGLAWETRLGATLPDGNEGDSWESVLHMMGDGHILYPQPKSKPIV